MPLSDKDGRTLPTTAPRSVTLETNNNTHYPSLYYCLHCLHARLNIVVLGSMMRSESTPSAHRLGPVRPRDLESNHSPATLTLLEPPIGMTLSYHELHPSACAGETSRSLPKPAHCTGEVLASSLVGIQQSRSCSYHF
jgi:hypothetical protein